MFGKEKKKLKSEDDKKPKVNIEKIPDVFYGGADPEIYHQHPASGVVPGPVKTAIPPDKPVIKKVVQPRPGSVLAEVKSKKLLYIVAGVFFVVAIGAISWYYINQVSRVASPAGQDEQETAVVVETPPTIEEDNTVIPPTMEEEPVPTTTPALEPQALEFPRMIFTNSVDLDSDSLTDMEEELFNTDSGTWDTDADGYYDGQETYNLYNPRGLAPIKLIDSGLIREYVNPTWGYRLYYPVGWQMGAVDAEADQVLFSAITGDYVEVRAVDRVGNESFQNWFSRNAVGQKFTDLVDFSNRFTEELQVRQDDLVAYLMDEKVVYVMIYHPGSTGSIPYRHVMQMIYQSFRPAGTTIEIPEQEILPTVSTTTIPATTTEEGEIIL